MRVASRGVRSTSAKNLIDARARGERAPKSPEISVTIREFSKDLEKELKINKYGLSNARSAQVYRRAILDSRVLVTRKGHQLLLPKLVTSEFRSPLDEVADGGGPESSHQSRRSFFRDDETPSGEKAVARESGIYLDARLDDIDRC